MKCLFPRLNSFGQKLVCVGAGVTLTGGFAGGVYYSSKYIDYQKKLFDSIDYVANKRKTNTTIDENEITQSPSFVASSIDKFFEFKIVQSCLIGLYKTWCYCTPVVCVLMPLPISFLMYHDVKEFYKMISNTDQCCTIIRKASIKTISYPALTGVAFGCFVIGYDELKKHHLNYTKKEE